MEIGGYQLAQQLPGGRFGARWRATGPNGEDVLLKQVARLDQATAPAVLEELARVRAVSNPNLARNDPPAQDASGGLWLVEEWVEGVSLGALCSEHVLSTGQSLGVARGMLGGLAALHRAGRVHGLVSPATVMLDLAGQPRLVDTGAWIAGREVASTDEYAAPEVVAGAAPGASADVFAFGRVITEILSAGTLDRVLADVLATATSADPAARQQDAPMVLAQLTQAAERAYGPVWWTLEGVGGAVASVAGAGTATAGTASSAGSLGAVSGSLSMDSPAIVAGADVGSSGPGVVQGVVRTGNRMAKLIPVLVGVIVIVVVVAGLAVANGNKPQPVALDAPISTITPSPATTASPAPTPTPTPPAALGFNGTYTYVSVRTKSNDSRFPVGERQTTTWVVKTTCVGEVCTSSADVDGSPVPIEQTSTGWVSDLTFPLDCIRFDTQKKIGSVNYRLVRKLTVVSVSDGLITKLAGTSSSRQLKACKIQTIPVGRFAYKVTMTLNR
ncbi:MAG TPA: protein kinase [Propionicimonas sp.]|uniref:serine/threonine protein kinase n=1 Tax=Propionicimonas sp. TaxID=1955623 RepID=UPI002F3EED54